MKKTVTSSNASQGWINDFEVRVQTYLKQKGDTLQNVGSDNPSTPKGN